MHIIFVHTPIPLRSIEGRQEYWYNFDKRYYAAHPKARLMKKFMWELPHWMTWLGGVLEYEGFTSMEALDFYTDCAVLDGIDEARIYNTLIGHPGDVYLFSPMTPNLPHALQIADMVKEIYPKSIVMLGGVIATPLHEKVAAHPSVDYVIRDRGEYALPALLKAIKNQGDLSKVKNVTFKAPNGRIVVNPDLYPYLPTDQLPFPKVDLFPSSVGEDLRYLRQVYALGCPYQCPFCTIQTIGRKPQYFSIERVISEIRAYQAHYGKHHHIYFGDETFTVHVGRTLDLCAALKAEGDITYDCQTRLNCLLDTRLPRALFESGCCWLEIGIETANQDTQDLFKQRNKLNATTEILSRLRDEGIPVCTFMVAGFPNESLDEMKRSVEWICSSIDDGLLTASYLSTLVPHPGTPFYEHPEMHGMTIHHQNYEFYHEDLPPVFDSKYATSEEVHALFIQATKDIGEAMGRTPYLKALAHHFDSGLLDYDYMRTANYQ